MYTLTINGKEICAQKDEALLYFLRETCKLTSVKNGCAEGACGACMILLDGKPTRACVLTTAKAAGKVRMEGKDYGMADGDVVEFRFNV